MKRKFLVAAAACAPLMAASAPAWAQLTISTSTSTPVATATAVNGEPADVDIISGGSIGVTAPGTGVTLNSNNSVNNAGEIGFTGIDNAVGILAEGGFTGTVANTGQIVLTETYTPTADPNNDGLYTGVFAMGSNRTGVEFVGPGTFNGGFLDTGVITIQGNNSQGISIQTPIAGDLMMLQVTAATSTTAATIVDGSISVTGDNSIGLQITPTGAIGTSVGTGNVRITTITATGANAQAVELNGPVGGYVDISGSITTTGYRTETRSTNPGISINYNAQEMQQGGASLTVGGNIGNGLIISAAPPILSTTNLDLDSDGVPDAVQGSGAVISYGAAPAIQIGAVSQNNAAAASITFGPYSHSIYAPTTEPAALNYGFVIQGTVTANSLFDQLTSPLLPTAVPATAIVIGGNILVSAPVYTFNAAGTIATSITPAVYAPSGAVSITGGLYNSGSITALAYQANATGIHIGALATVPSIFNDGQIFASSIQVNSATTPTTNGNYPVTPTPLPVNVTAIQIDQNASVSSITNNGGIIAQITGTAGEAGSTIAILDKSGTLQTIDNTGSIEADLNQTLVSAPMIGPTTAIDISASTLAQTITQTVSPLASASSTVPYSATASYAVAAIVSYDGNIYQNVVTAGPGYDPIDYPSYWREIGAVSPSIIGDIYFGSGPDTLDIEGGTVSSRVIAMGGALNTITVNGGAGVNGSFSESGTGQFVINVINGTLSDTNVNNTQTLNNSQGVPIAPGTAIPGFNAGAVRAISVNVGATGVLEIAADPVHGLSTEFVTSGASVFASGAQVGLTLSSLQFPLVQTYTVVQAVGQGTITAGGLGPTAVGYTPFLYSASASYVPATATLGAQIDLTVTRKTAAQLGFNAAEAAAYPAILQAIPNDLPIQQTLLGQTTESGLKSAYDQLLPNQGQGIFQALDAAAEKVSGMSGTTPDAGTRVGGGSSLWLQEVNEEVDRRGLDSLGSSAQLLGLVGGYERMGAAGGALGFTLAYFNAQETNSAAAIGAHELASLVETSVYYRRSIGPFTASGRVGGGYGWFSENRQFVSASTLNQAQAAWAGEFVDAHFGASYEVHFGAFYARPEVTLDYLRLHQNGYNEYGGGSGYDLNVAAQDDTQFTGQALMVLGRQWGRTAWLRSEVRFGYREVFDGDVGDTTASFADGTSFTTAGDPDKGGWATVGFSLKTGTQFSYLALEGDADFRQGEQRYDLRVAGRSMF